LDGLDVEVVLGDLTDFESLRRAVAGCRWVYHVAADYRLWAANPRELYETNVGGTRNLILACQAEGIERMVYTSTVGTLGLARDGQPANEETPVGLEDMIGHYKRSKFLAEAEVKAWARRGFPVVIVNPSTPVGPGDVKPTPTGQMIVDFLNGRMPAYIETGLNLIDVEDVAAGHLLAMEKGRVGERYILGNQNATFAEILQMLAKVSGRPRPRIRMPFSVAMGLAVVSTALSTFTHRPPRIPIEGVRMARKKMFFDASKAVRELGLPQSPVEGALAKAVAWFQANGYVR